MNKVWKENEKQFIRDNAATMKDSEIAAYLSRTVGREVTIEAVRKQRQKLRITKKSGRGICSLAKEETRSDNIARAVRREEHV